MQVPVCRKRRPAEESLLVILFHAIPSDEPDESALRIDPGYPAARMTAFNEANAKTALASKYRGLYVVNVES